MNTVWILGSMNMDVTYAVERFPQEGMTIASTNTFSSVGGKGTNQSAAAAWTGAQVRLVGATGNDVNARTIREKISEYSVDMSHLYSADAPTGSAVILVNSSGANLIVVNGGANKKVPCRKLDFKKGDFIAAQLETNLDAVEFYFRQAKEAGATTVLNPSPYIDIPKPILDNTDIVVANEHEAGMMIGKKIADAADVHRYLPEFGRSGINRIVVTLGKNGAAVITDGAFHEIKGIEANAVDTQGAGDAFLGVFVGRLAGGAETVAAAQYANRIAARCVEVKGSTLDSLPPREDGGEA